MTAIIGRMAIEMKAFDQADVICERVADAYETGQTLAIEGSGSKAFLPGGKAEADATLGLSGHTGIVDYDPKEWFITARSGTPIRDIEAALLSEGQMLGFEPPHFGEGATLGGVIASGFCGSRRPFAGSARDAVLGVRMVNGRGENLRFGGTVMKNVAGFDVSRLMVGSRGTLGVLLEVTLKVVPRPEVEKTLVLPKTWAEGLAHMQVLQGTANLFSGLANDGSWSYLRIAGPERAVLRVQADLGAEEAADGPGFWYRLREQKSRFFTYPPLGHALFRLSVPSAAPASEIPGEWFYDWGGALRWLRTNAPAEAVFRAAAQLRGHARLFRATRPLGAMASPLAPALQELNARVKAAFDPKRLFNPGVMP